jgi:hypothetical protein
MNHTLPTTPPAIIRPAATADDLQHVVGMAQQHMATVERKKEEIKAKKELIDNSLQNDQEYSELDDQARELRNKMKAAKARVMQENNLIGVAEDIKEMKADLKDEQLTLFGYLDQYRLTTGENTIEDINGEVVKIHRNYKITKRA